MKLFTGFWSEQASCKGHTHLFYPKNSERPQAKDRREQKAKMFCAICPVLNLCRQHARTHNEYGVWGGENEEERFNAGYDLPKYSGLNNLKRIRRQRQIKLEKESL